MAFTKRVHHRPVIQTPQMAHAVSQKPHKVLGWILPEPDDDCDEVVLHRCPLLAAARRFPDVVCQVHLGMVQSVLEAEGADPDRAELTPFTAPGECRLRLLA